MSPWGPRGANFWVTGGHFGRLFRVLFESVLLGRFGMDFCNIFPPFCAVLRQVGGRGGGGGGRGGFASELCLGGI